MTTVDLLDKIANLPAQIRVIARSVVTILVAVQATVLVVVEQFGDDLPVVARAGAWVLVPLAAAIAAISSLRASSTVRRVTDGPPRGGRGAQRAASPLEPPGLAGDFAGELSGVVSSARPPPPSSSSAGPSTLISAHASGMAATPGNASGGLGPIRLGLNVVINYSHRIQFTIARAQV